MKPKVYLTGAGPGDPGLITLKAVNCLKQAEVVIYDRLVNPELLKYAPAGAETIYAGKSSQKHSLTQDKINRLIIKKAKEGKTVVRLKGGDPFLFGRGAEEALELAKNNIPFEVVPGVSSAIAVAAYAGVPLTHRRFTSSVGIFTGHEESGKEGSSIAWEKIAIGLGTLVFLMGVENLTPIIKNLLKFGRSPLTPCCLIQNGTLPKQKTVSTTLDKIIPAARAFKFRPPSILIVGEVVSLRKKLNWLENKPLFGKRILITRPQDEDNRFAQILEDYGAECLRLPAIAIKPLKDYSQLDTAIKNISQFQWVIFSSQNGVRVFKERRDIVGTEQCSVPTDLTKFAAIGPATACALEDLGLKVSLQPQEFCQEGLLKSLAKLKLKGQNILIINALEARDVLARGLEKMVAKVTVAPAYQTAFSCQLSAVSKKILSSVDIITFTSSLAAKSFLSGFSPKSLKTSFKNTLIASIGPITSKAIKAAGLKVQIEAKEYTLEGLAKAIVSYSYQSSAISNQLKADS